MEQFQRIVIGDLSAPSFVFEGGVILSTSGDFSTDMIGAELCTDVMEAEVSYDDIDGELQSLPWATPVYFYFNDQLAGKLYSVSVVRTARKKYLIRTTSAAGIMDHDTYYGGYYSGETFRSVVEQIIGTNGLQPYGGVYNRYYRKKDTSSSTIIGYALGDYYDKNKTQKVLYGSLFSSATMASKLFSKIKIYGFSNQSYDLYISLGNTPTTTFRCKLLGAVVDDSASSYLKKYQYGLYMDMSRADVNVPFPAFGNVVFVYGNTSISLGTPSSADEAVYEIEVDPGAGTAVINGVSYQISLDGSLANDACALHVYGGGANLVQGADDNITALTVTHNCEFETFYYAIYAPEGDLQAKFVAVKHVFFGGIGLYDYVSQNLRKMSNDANLANSFVWDADLSPYDPLMYGECVLFNNRTDFQTDVLSGITYAEGIDTIQIHGWLPICSKREALQQILFATGIIIIKDADGSILFSAPSAQSAKTIDENAIYDEGSEEQFEHTNSVELTEHAYTLNTSSADNVLFDNTGYPSNKYYIAQYSEVPSKYRSVSGLVHIISNSNAAIVRGSGQIKGEYYDHAETVLHREIANFPDGRVVSVADATLVTLLNSEYVLDRLAAYYGAASKTSVDLVWNGERCGLTYTLINAFGEAFSGFLVRASKKFTSIVRASCEFIRGYTPPEFASWYANFAILTGSGTWTVPASVFERETPRIHVVLIGGGAGGDSGFAGENGAQPVRGESAEMAEGGAAGDSGSGGKIFEVTITNPAPSYEYSCGQGGAGGVISYSHDANNPGSSGGDTIFSGGGQGYSSGNGASRESGIVNGINGARYAARLIRSQDEEIDRVSDGGSGGYFESLASGILYHAAQKCIKTIMGRRYETWTAGARGQDIRNGIYLSAAGGAGGGAGYGQNGSPGGAAEDSGELLQSGNGGKGGDATETPPNPTTYNQSYYGYGGLGGGGGGGGGAGGWVTVNHPSVTGTGGAGGYGGKGGDGADGCVLIYY